MGNKPLVEASLDELYQAMLELGLVPEAAEASPLSDIDRMLASSRSVESVYERIRALQEGLIVSRHRSKREYLERARASQRPEPGLIEPGWPMRP